MPSRRRMLQTALALLVARLSVPLPLQAAEGRSANAFNARSLDSALNALGLPRGQSSPAITITAPDVAENGANVPVEVAIRLSDVERVLVLSDKNIFPLLADLHFSSRVKPWFELKVKMAETADLVVIAQAGGTLYTATRQVRVIVGGCLPG